MDAMRSCWCVCVVLASCLDQPGGGQWEPTAPTVPRNEKCDALVDLLCTRVTACAAPSNGIDYEACIARFGRCTPMIFETPSTLYDVCVASITDFPCFELVRPTSTLASLPLPFLCPPLFEPPPLFEVN